MILLLHNHDPMCQKLHNHFTQHAIPCISIDLKTLVKKVSFIYHQAQSLEKKGLVYQNQFIPITQDTMIYQQLMLCHRHHLTHFHRKDRIYAAESWRALFNSFFFNHPNLHNRIHSKNLLSPYPCPYSLRRHAKQAGFQCTHEAKNQSQHQQHHIITHHVGSFTFATYYRTPYDKRRFHLPKKITQQCAQLMHKQQCTVGSCHLIQCKQTYYFKQFNPFPDWHNSAWPFHKTVKAWERLLCPKKMITSTLIAKQMHLQTIQVKQNAADCFIDLSQRPLL